MAELRSNLKMPLASDEDGRIKIVLEENDNIPPTGLFVGDNGVGYMLQPGVELSVPPGVVEILNNAITSVPVVDPQTLEVIDYRPKKLYPYSRV
jgi:hypothetical protein